MENSNIEGEQDALLSVSGNMNGIERRYSLSAFAIGICIGTVINLANTYYGLRVGSASQMSMVSAVLGYGFLQLLSKYTTRRVSVQENVLIISTATATGCMPITAGFIGVIPALEFLIGPEENGPVKISIARLVLWSVGLCFFGILFAFMLQETLITRHNLPWPGAKATSQMVKTLHQKREKEVLRQFNHEASFSQRSSAQNDRNNATAADEHIILPQKDQSKSLSKMSWLWFGTMVSGIWTFCMYFFPILHDLPLFGDNAARQWAWSVDLSPGIFGQGLILGPIIPFHMLFGAIIGWGILSPYAKYKGWAPGDVDDWNTGSRGWIIWISLSALLADASVNLAWLILRPIKENRAFRSSFRVLLDKIMQRIPRSEYRIGWHLSTKYTRIPSTSSCGSEAGPSECPANETHQTSATPASSSSVATTDSSDSPRALFVSFGVATIICMSMIQVVFGKYVRWYYSLIAIALSLPMAVVGIRSLAETDYNPENALVSQLSFAALVAPSDPSRVIINLIAASIAQAGANQAGSLAYDLKIGSLLNAKPEVQVIGQLAGSLVGALISCLTYRVYTSQYPIPGPLFKIPASFLVLSTTRLITGRGLPKGLAPFTIITAILSAIITIIKIRYELRWWQKLVPSGTAFAIGIYNAPSFTIIRVLGGMVCWYIERRHVLSQVTIMVLASGLLLGESIASLASIGLAALHVSRFGA